MPALFQIKALTGKRIILKNSDVVNRIALQEKIKILMQF